jgi:hypothetical protein
VKNIPTFSCAALALFSVRAGAQGSIAGTVYDSLSTHAPLANATIVLVERNKYATSDARGHFRMDSVPDGHYTLGVMHPILDSLDLTAPLVAVDVSGGREATVTLTTPSARTALARMCPGANAEYSGVIIGRVRDVDDGSALALATVSTDWTEFTVANGKSASRRVRAKIQTKPNGVYLLCNVPIKVPLELQADWSGFVAGPTPVQLDDRLIRRAEFAVSRRDSASRGDRLRDSSAAPAVALGTATLRGVVRGADGKLVRDATVSVLGTARSVRSDGKGAFRLDHIPAGTRSIEARSVGLLPTIISIDFATNAVRDTALLMTRVVQELKPVAVEAPMHMAPQMERSGFNERRTQALGAFLTEEDISKHGYSDLISILQGVRGVHVNRGPPSRSQSGFAQPMAYLKGINDFNNTQDCIPNYFIDGSQYPVRTYQDFSDLSGIAMPAVIRGIEVYANPGTIPVQYDLMSSTGCGSIVIWTR